MATNLTSVAIKDGFQQLLHCDGGLTSTEASVIDGDGTASILSLGTTSATIGGALIVSGNLTVNGSQTILNTATLSVEDNSILLNSNVTGTPSTNAGIEIERGDSTNTSIRWNESTDRWQFTNDGSTFNNFPLSADLDHDQLTNFVANEHIDWTTDQGSTNIHSGNYTDTNTNQLTTFTVKDNNQPTTKTIEHGKYLQFTSSGSASPAQPTLSGVGTSGDPFVLLTQYITYSAGNSGLVPAAGTSGHYLKHNGAFGQVAFSELSGTTALLTTSSVIADLYNVDSSTPTNGQILKYNTGVSRWLVQDQDSANTTWVLEDGDSTRVTVADSKYVKFVEGGNIDINWTNTANGVTDDEYDLTFTATNTNQLTEFYLQDDDGDSIHISHDEYIKFMNGSGITTNWNALDAAGTSGDPHILTITSTTAGTVNAVGVTAPITGGVTLNASSGTIGHSAAAGYTHVPTTASQSGKFLKAVTDSGGSEAWATLTEADISDLGTYLTTSQAQSSYLPKTSPTLTADTTLSMNNGRISARTSAGGASDGLGTAGQVLHSHASGGGVYWGTISSTPSVNIIDGDIHEVNLANKWIKFVEGNNLIDINFTDTSEGATDNPYDLTFTINSGNITSVGTIGTGVWNGTAINQTYLVGQSGTNTGDQDLSGYLPLTGGTMSDNIHFGNYGEGMVGVYSATKYQAVFAMGNSYKLANDGSGTGDLYGIAWTHHNISGESKSGLGHQALFMSNGTTRTAIGDGIWTTGQITADSDKTVWHSGNDGSGSGLDADTVDGLNVHTGTNNSANQIVRTNGSGYIDTGWINTISGVASGTPTRIYCSEDAYLRYYTPASLAPYILNQGSTKNSHTHDYTATQGNYVWTHSSLASTYDIGLSCSFVSSSQGWQNYGGVLHVGSRGSSDAGGDFQLFMGHGTNYGGTHLQLRSADNDATPSDSWTGWKTILDSGNYGGYANFGSTTLTSGTINCTDIYSSQWFRNVNQTGLYNSTHLNHFYSYNANYWVMDSDYGMQFRVGHNGTLKGSIYFDGNGFGLLNDTGNWAVQVAPGNGDVSLHYASAEKLVTQSGGVTITGTATISTEVSSNSHKITESGARWYNISASYLGFSTWLQGSSTPGLYFPTSGSGDHWYPSAATYGSFNMNGSKNGYSGIFQAYSGVWNGMYDSAGNGGDYYSGLWYTYFHRANTCMGIGTSSTSSSYGLYVSGAIYSTGDIIAYSDARIKTNVKLIDSPLDKVMAMRGVYYNRIDEGELTSRKSVGERCVGMIAQELNEVLPEAVTYAKDVDKYGIDYGKVTSVLIEAIKELKNEVNELRNKYGVN